MPAYDLEGKVYFSKIGKGLEDDIDMLLASYDIGPPIIQGGLTVTGHSYWVILEYGSSPAAGTRPGPRDTDPVILKIPFNAPQRSKGHTTWYPIRPRRRKVLVFKQNGRTVVRNAVEHPGNIPRAFLRRIIASAQERLFAELLQAGSLMRRDELVKILNLTLLEILNSVRAATPTGLPDKYIPTSDDRGHLRDAWGLELAR